MARADDRAGARRVRIVVLRFVYRSRRGRTIVAAGTIHSQPGRCRAFARWRLAIATAEISSGDRERLTDPHLRLYREHGPMECRRCRNERAAHECRYCTKRI